MSEKTLEVVRGIGQALADAYDGALNEDGTPLEVGLKREQGHPVYNSRKMDGFKGRISGTHLILTYQTELQLRDVYGTKLENELEQTMADIVKYLKKRYKQITKNTLGLKPTGEVDAHVQKINNRITKCVAKKMYEISGLKDVVDKLDPSKEELEKSFKKFLDQGAWGSKSKPSNVTRTS